MTADAAATGERPKVAVEKLIRRSTERLVMLSHRIHEHPELAWEEHSAAAWLAEELESVGYVVEQGAYQLPTAVRATTGNGPLHLVLCAEYDALPAIGHACGHNIIAASAMGAALGLAPLADDLGLTVTVLGTPAEEGGGGKVLMLERGAFDRAHLAMMVHPGPVDVALAEPYARLLSRITYQGRATHAAAYPERGVNAADAFTVAQVSIGLLRQQLPDSVRVHGIVTSGGDAPNVIPERTEGRWAVRANSMQELAEVLPKVMRCFKAGALATGCELQVDEEGPAYTEFRNHAGLLERYVGNATRLGRRFDAADPAGRMNRASTDMGNVSLAIPAIHPYIGIESMPYVNHQAGFAAHAASPAGDRAVIDAAIALAQTAVDAATDAELCADLIAGPDSEVSEKTFTPESVASATR